VFHDNYNTVALSGYFNDYGGYAFLVTSTSNPDYHKFDEHVGFKGEPNSHPPELNNLINQYVLDLTYGIKHGISKHGISKSYKIPASVFDNLKP